MELSWTKAGMELSTTKVYMELSKTKEEMLKLRRTKAEMGCARPRWR